jgi:alcohol dehydrogenase class IV
MRPFGYTGLPVRVVFGHGTIGQVAGEIRRLGCRRALVLSTPPQRSDAERLAAQRIAREPADREARAEALYGAWACGTCLGSVGMALHHKLCHVLGGSFDLPHAETHTVLPHALAYNALAAPEAMARVARALRVPEAAQGLFDLARDLGAPTTLREIGMPEHGLDQAADLAVAAPYWNPRAVERAAIRALLQDAFKGSPPRTLVPTPPAETAHA